MRGWLIGLAAALVLSTAASAQDPAPRQRGTPEQRAEAERRFRAQLAEVVRQRLGLTDEQARRLQEVDRRFEPQRRSLMQREMQTRRALRQQIAAGDSANQTATANLLEQMLTLQRERTDLTGREQRELAAFLTPVQRAKFLALQADLHRRMMNVRRGSNHRRDSGRSGPGDRRPPRP